MFCKNHKIISVVLVVQIFVFASCFQKSYAEMIIIYDQAPVYPEPDTNSILIANMSLCDVVNPGGPIYWDKYKRSITNDWFYINTGFLDDNNLSGPTVQGWIQKKYLAISSDFKPVKEFQDLYIHYFLGDGGFEFQFYKNGKYASQFSGYHDNTSNQKKGTIYQYKNIVSANGEDYFYFNEEGKLLSPHRDRSKLHYEASTNIAEFPNWASNTTEATNQSSQNYTLTGDSVRVRSEAGTNGEVLTNLNRGAKVRLLSRLEEEVDIGGKKGRWAFVKTEENGVGWVFDAYLKEDNSR